MRTTKVATLTAGLALAAAGTVAAVAVPAAQATTPSGAAPATANRNCVGAWEARATIDPGRPPLRILISFFADGNLLLGEQGALPSNVPGGADVEFNSPGHGAWKPAAARACRFTVKVYSADIDGNDSGQATVRGTVTVPAGGDTFTGTADFTTSLPDGGGVGPVPITVTGTRIQP